MPRGPKVTDLTGLKVGRLEVLAYSHKTRTKDGKGYIHRWLCRCDCGTEKPVSGPTLKAGTVLSCGCLNRERVSASGKERTTHGYTGSASSLEERRLHRVWRQMRQRCNNSKDQRYNYYGGRGIKVCSRWEGKEGFQNFLADTGPRPTGGTIEREDNDKDYSPDNCRWASRYEQAVNSRNAKMIEHEGQTLCIKDWSRQLGIPYKRLHGRLYRGEPFEKAISRP